MEADSDLPPSAGQQPRDGVPGCPRRAMSAHGPLGHGSRTSSSVGPWIRERRGRLN